MIPDYEVQQIVNLLNNMCDEGDGWHGRASGAIKYLLEQSDIELIPFMPNSTFVESYEWKRKEPGGNVPI